MRFIDYKTSEVLMQSLASAVEVELNDAIKNRGVATFVIPGGTTPKPFFKILRDANIEWDKITIFPTDERWVSMRKFALQCEIDPKSTVNGSCRRG